MAADDARFFLSVTASQFPYHRKVTCSGCGRTAPAAPAAPAGDGFPVTIEHKYGSTEIGAQPQRVVTIGFTDHDVVLARGVGPVGVGTDDDGYSKDQPFGIWPWAQPQTRPLSS